MAKPEPISGDGAMEVIPLQFNVPGHHLPLTDFIETASQTQAIIRAFNDELFDGRLE